MTEVPPQPTLTDGELTLRPWREGDVDAVYALNDDEISRWFDHPRNPSHADVVEAVARWHQQYDDDRAGGSFLVELAGDPVGHVEVRRSAPGVGEIWWTTYKPFRGRRIAPRAVRMLIAYCFGELGLDRVHAQVDPENRAAIAVAVKAGLHREGLLRGSTTLAGQRRDVLVFGLRRDDPPADTVPGWTAQMDSLLPKKRVIAHVVVRDTRGRILLCTTGFKRDLELPGGVVEPNEDPATAARREVDEELGVELPVGGIVALDWLPPWHGWGDAIEILYDGGVHSPDLLRTLRPDGREILKADWYAAHELEGLVSPLNARRLPRILAEPDRVHHLRDGNPA